MDSRESAASQDNENKKEVIDQIEQEKQIEKDAPNKIGGMIEISNDDQSHEIEKSLISVQKNNNDKSDNGSYIFESEDNDNDDQLTPDQMKDISNKICLNVFLNYSKFYYEERDFLIANQAILKLLIKVNIINNRPSSKIKLNQFDIIMKQISPKSVSKLSFHQFLNLIILLSNRNNPSDFNQNPKIALYSFITQHFSPIINYINSNSSNFTYRSIESKINNLSIQDINTPPINIILKSQYKSLMIIFKIYFKNELSLSIKSNEIIEKLIKESLMNLIEFAKNYDLCPYLLSIEQIAVMYNCFIDKNDTQQSSLLFNNIINTNENKNSGNVFTVYKLFLFLLYASNIVYENETEFLHERLILLFERMNKSNGLVKTAYKQHIPSKNSISFDLNNTILQQVSQSITNTNVDTEFNFNDKKKPNDIPLNHINNANLLLKDNNDINHLHKQIITKRTNSALIYNENNERYNEFLEEFFDTYSTIGDKMTHNQMTITSFIKLLKDFDIFTIKITNHHHYNSDHSIINNNNINTNEYLTETDATLIFFEVCGNITRNKIGKTSLQMSYDSFIIALNRIAIRLHPDLSLNEALYIFKSHDLALDQSIQKTERSVIQIEDLIYSIKNCDLQLILYDLQIILHKIYLNYADLQEMLNFKNFFAFYNDFSIFPDIANLIEIKKMFFIILQIQTKEKIDRGTMKESNESKYDTMIQFDYFLYSLAIASRFAKGKDNINEYERLMHLFYKMTISKGINNPRRLIGGGRLQSINKELIQMIDMIKIKYKHDFPSKQQKSIKSILKSKNAFNDLFNQ